MYGRKQNQTLQSKSLHARSLQGPPNLEASALACARISLACDVIGSAEPLLLRGWLSGLLTTNENGMTEANWGWLSGHNLCGCSWPVIACQKLFMLLAKTCVKLCYPDFDAGAVLASR